MTNVFDLQLFAEDAEEETVEVPADDQPEEAKEEPAEKPAEEKQEIPEELDGLDLSSDEVKDILKEANIPEDKPDADADSDTKPVQATEETPKQNIPYARFKEVLDKQHAADEEIANLKRQLAEAQTKAATPPPAPHPVQQQRPQEVPTFTPEIAKQIDDAANKQAMQMTGMTQEDIEALEYADENDAKAKTYRYAKDLARANIIENIQQSARRQQEYAAKILENHAKLVNEYNSFYQEQQAQPDYQDVVQFATNEFFEKQAPGVQFAVSDAYNRVQRNTASPQDILVVKNYFEKAQGAFRAKSAPTQQKQTQDKKPSMPRAQEVAGSAASPKETVSIASLSKMLEENRFEDLPKKYQDILLGM